MTTLEQLAKLAYERMFNRTFWRMSSLEVKPNWEGEVQLLRDDWIETTRAVIEGLREIQLPPKTPPGRSGTIATPLDFWLARLNAILEEKQ
jgi:hypothetical protein